MRHYMLKCVDWFIPESSQSNKTQVSVMRIFIATHLLGPAFSQSISAYLLYSDPARNWIVFTIIVAISSFWMLPLLLKYHGNLQTAALISFNILTATALFGAFHYGGVTSPFLPWVIIALLLGFFYLPDRPYTITICFGGMTATFFLCHFLFGFSDRITLDSMTTLGWISISGAATYMSWMAYFYSNAVSDQQSVELEVRRHIVTAQRLEEAKNIAEQANQTRSIFLAKMSHELRTPLNAVIGYSELLMETMGDAGASPQKLADLGRISSAGKHLLTLFDDVLDMSKIESSTIDVIPEFIDLDALAQNIADTVAPLVARNHNVMTVRSQSKGLVLQSDAKMVRQILLNFLSNAAKFTTRGTITLSICAQRLGSDNWIEFAVTDTGIGIPPEAIPKLFSSFAQVSAATSAIYGGTGIGLSVCRKFSTLLGGQINVESDVGQGSTFTIRLPEVFQEDSLEHEANTCIAGSMPIAA